MGLFNEYCCICGGPTENRWRDVDKMIGRSRNACYGLSRLPGVNSDDANWLSGCVVIYADLITPPGEYNAVDMSVHVDTKKADGDDDEDDDVSDQSQSDSESTTTPGQGDDANKKRKDDDVGHASNAKKDAESNAEEIPLDGFPIEDRVVRPAWASPEDGPGDGEYWVEPDEPPKLVHELCIRLAASSARFLHPKFPPFPASGPSDPARFFWDSQGPVCCWFCDGDGDDEGSDDEGDDEGSEDEGDDEGDDDGSDDEGDDEGSDDEGDDEGDDNEGDDEGIADQMTAARERSKRLQEEAGGPSAKTSMYLFWEKFTYGYDAEAPWRRGCSQEYDHCADFGVEHLKRPDRFPSIYARPANTPDASVSVFPVECPADLTLHIVSFLQGGRDIFALEGVSRAWRDFLRSSLAQQYVWLKLVRENPAYGPTDADWTASAEAVRESMKDGPDADWRRFVRSCDADPNMRNRKRILRAVESISQYLGHHKGEDEDT